MHVYVQSLSYIGIFLIYDKTVFPFYQTLTSSSIVTYTVTLTEEIIDMFVQDTNLIFFMYLQKQICPLSFPLTYVLFIMPRGT